MIITIIMIIIIIIIIGTITGGPLELVSHFFFHTSFDTF